MMLFPLNDLYSFPNTFFLIFALKYSCALFIDVWLFVVIERTLEEFCV